MSTAMLVFLQDKASKTTAILTVRPGERVVVDRFENDTYPHIKIVPVNGSFNGITTHRFTGAAVITDANGVSLTTIEAGDHMAKEVDNGADN